MESGADGSQNESCRTVVLVEVRQSKTIFCSSIYLFEFSVPPNKRQVDERQIKRAQRKSRGSQRQLRKSQGERQGKLFKKSFCSKNSKISKSSKIFKSS